MSAVVSDSRLVSRLDEAIRAASHPVAAACLRVERAGVLAREGKADEAVAEIAAVRHQFAARPDVEVSVWICIAEGWLAHYTNVSGSASDKMKRAWALSTAAGLTELQALSAAWLAHFAYFRADALATAKYLTLAFKHAKQNSHSALARASLVAAISFHFAEDFERAQPWYVKARTHAASGADDVTLSALIHNMGWLRAGHALKAAIFGGDSASLAQHALAIFQSTDNQDRRIGSVSLGALMPIHRAMIASVQGEYALAVELYEGNMLRADEQGLSYLNPCVLANAAWCHMQLNDFASAQAVANSAMESLSLAAYPEDRMLAKGRLAQVFNGLGDAARGHQLLLNASADLAEHQALQKSFVVHLSKEALNW